MDYGADNYAGVTWNNTGDKKILAGWMSNWLYAQVVPTQKWRSGLTIPRVLSLIIEQWWTLRSPRVRVTRERDVRFRNFEPHF